VSTEENRAIFRRYVEEVPDQGKLELADEIFDRYLSHQPEGSMLEHGPEDGKRVALAVTACLLVFVMRQDASGINRSESRRGSRPGQRRLRNFKISRGR
jgi:hypothetical protein